MCALLCSAYRNKDVMVTQHSLHIDSKNIEMLKRHFPRRHFIDGMASVLDIGGRYYSRHLDYRCRTRRIGKPVPLNSDTDALQSDWVKIGLDIDKVSRKYGENLS